MAVFWDVAPCSLVDIDRSFRGAYCLLILEAANSIPEDSYLHTRRRENLRSHYNICAVDYLPTVDLYVQ
jgi:hypothetical protein